MSREYQILSELKGHARCVELLDVFFSLGEDSKLTQNFILEYVPDSLENYIDDSKKNYERIDIATIKKIMRQTLEGLSFIHSKKICHRDVKPDNILMDDKMNVKLSDFGSSKKLDGKSFKNIPHVVSRYYRAPELLLCHTDYSTKIDIWAAGCILIELFTQEPLFPGKTEGMQLLEIMAVMGSPNEDDREYMYCCLNDSTKKLVEKVQKMPGIDLKSLFPENYRSADIKKAVSLAEKMLEWNPKRRISAEDALNHSFFK